MNVKILRIFSNNTYDDLENLEVITNKWLRDNDTKINVVSSQIGYVGIPGERRYTTITIWYEELRQETTASTMLAMSGFSRDKESLP